MEEDRAVSVPESVETGLANQPEGAGRAVQLTIRFPKWLLPTAQKQTKLVDRYGRPLH
jgi:hypothetical protein